MIIICIDCINRDRKLQAEAMDTANEHMDALGVPDDALIRGLASVNIAGNINPWLADLIREMYPMHEQFCQ